ncbi:MAG TPA: hypothetical protein VG125_23815 [Pirellulales bacterium]|jgi:hypothetical protein|nr:hypothetical protein [Pirellulales bacterium]
MRYQHFLIGLSLLWLVGLLVPGLPMPVGIIVYVAIGLAIAHSALKHRSTGWASGVLLAVLLLTLPLWIWAMYAIYERWRE